MKIFNGIIPLIVFLFSCYPGYSQNTNNEIVYWNDTLSGLQNFRIISMLEAPDNKIYLLSKATDQGYNNPHPNFTRMDFNGKVLNTNTIITQDVYELNSIVALPDGKVKIIGTTSSSGYMLPYFETLDAKGNTDPYIYNYNIVPIYPGKVFKTDDGFYNETIATFNPQGGSDNADPNEPGALWNVWIYKKDYRKKAVSEQEVWHRKIVSEYHEEPVNTIQSSDKSIISLSKRYTTPDFDRYIPVLYCLSPEGEVTWTKELPNEENYVTASIVTDKNGNIYSMFNFGNEQMILNHTSVYLHSSKGDSLKFTWIDKFCANGGVLNKDNNIILYGGIYKAESGYSIKKATTCLIDKQLTVLNQNSMDMFDAPDAEIPGLGFTVYPTSSDFLTGISLSDGRYALGGRVYMPERINASVDEIIAMPRYNQNLVIFTNQTGDFGTYKEKE
jgi:hypothetical protein